MQELNSDYFSCPAHVTVENHSEMKKLTDSLKKDTLITVEDATADPTVENGSAMYHYSADSRAATKITDGKSLDIPLVWESIRGVPCSNKTGYNGVEWAGMPE